MSQSQLSLFKQKLFPISAKQQIVEPVVPTGESTIMQTLPTYMDYLRSTGYSESTIEKYFSDIKKISVFFSGKKIGEITTQDLQQWIAGLVTPKGDMLDRKTVNRKVSAIINYFLWLKSLEALTEDPAAPLNNARIQSPLPDYLYEEEIKQLYTQASKDPRTYLLVLLLLETGMKSNELFMLTKAHVDTSDPYSSEIWLKHVGKETKKDRKLALPPQFSQVYHQYVEQYKVEDRLFPYTDRFIQMLFVELKKQTGIEKDLTPKTLRHTHVVRAYKRGEDPNRIFERIGLAPDSRKEAGEMYSRLASRGI